MPHHYSWCTYVNYQASLMRLDFFSNHSVSLYPPYTFCQSMTKFEFFYLQYLATDWCSNWFLQYFFFLTWNHGVQKLLFPEFQHTEVGRIVIYMREDTTSNHECAITMPTATWVTQKIRQNT